MEKVFFIILLLLSAFYTRAQDSPKVADTASESVVAPAHSLSQPFQKRQHFLNHLLQHNTFFKVSESPALQLMPSIKQEQKVPTHQSVLFYLLLGLCFLLAIIRFGFQKYFHDLFRAFYSPTLSQRQLKDQLYQTPFPGFALNIFFSLSGGIYLYLILLHTHYLSVRDPLYLIAFFVALLILSYTLKYIMLRICSWLFGLKELLDNYIFTLFLINKVLGVILVPFILILAFSPATISGPFFTVSLIFILFLFLYRYIRVLPMVQSSANLSKFHFFLYICALEIAPILIIGKLTIIWLNGA